MVSFTQLDCLCVIWSPISIKSLFRVCLLVVWRHDYRLSGVGSELLPGIRLNTLHNLSYSMPQECQEGRCGYLAASVMAMLGPILVSLVVGLYYTTTTQDWSRLGKLLLRCVFYPIWFPLSNLYYTIQDCRGRIA